jgi:hypothetical protein
MSSAQTIDDRSGRYGRVCPNVSQSAGSPERIPVVNQCWRAAAEPWVKVSGVTQPRVCFWMRSSPIAAAASSASAISCWATLPLA